MSDKEYVKALKYSVKWTKIIVLPTAMYAGETRQYTGTIFKHLDVFQQRCLIRNLKLIYTNRVKNGSQVCMQSSRNSNKDHEQLGVHN